MYALNKTRSKYIMDKLNIRKYQLLLKLGKYTDLRDRVNKQANKIIADLAIQNSGRPLINYLSTVSTVFNNIVFMNLVLQSNDGEIEILWKYL
jgi:hypothetical protein